MPRKQSLIFLQTADALVGALCGPDLKSREALCLRRAPCPDSRPESLRAALDCVLEALTPARPGVTGTEPFSFPADVRLCLAADMALFRDWSFPFRSGAKARQALNLLLETEFPCDASALGHRICLTGGADGGKGLQAVSVSLPAGLPEAWQAALAERGLYPRLITVDPFPLLLGLPRLKGVSLFLHLRPGYSVLAALDSNVVRRVRVLERPLPPQGGDCADTAALVRAAALALDGLPLTPERLLICGEACRGREAAALGDAFELPAQVLGRDTLLYGLSALPGESEADCLSVLCLAKMPLRDPRRRRLYPAFQQARSFSGVAGLSPARCRKLIPAAACLLCLALAFLFSVWAEGHARHRQARELEAQTQAIYRKAVPDARGPASLMRMRSILQGRLADLRGEQRAQSDFPVLRLLRAMHTSAPPKLAVRVDRLSLDAKHCRISGSAVDYDAVNSLRDAFAGIPGVAAVNIVSAASRTGKNAAGAERGRSGGGTVHFELDLLREEARP